MSFESTQFVLDEIICFHEELVTVILSGKMAAVLDAGDTYYEHFGRAVNILEETLRNQGCKIIILGLKVDRGSEEEIKAVSLPLPIKINQLTMP